jgi:hypothetical protein
MTEDKWAMTVERDKHQESLETQLRKASQELQHQQQMVKQLLNHIENEQNRRRINEDALMLNHEAASF